MGSGFVIGAISLILVIGGISLALAETSTPAPTPTPFLSPTTFAVEFASPFPTQSIPTEIPSQTSFPSATIAPTKSCTIPAGWVLVTVGTNDTLYTIAERYKTTADNLSTGNCLDSTDLTPGSLLYVPLVPTVTVIPCGPPFNWVKTHTVQAGENLYRISLLYRTTVSQLQSANCMGASTIIHVGQVLWVPNVPTSTPAITITNTNTATQTNTFTATPDFSTPTATFIVTSSPVPATSTLSITPLPSATPTTPTP